ncbi:serine/arginine-rich splicing factor 4-like [Vespula squamosa]|uniref:Serine/arginine-rich splicing factor 4-like n=1 Tax=Vespula squamosa TaxID=30214 RepID=A0ABD1ZSV1_VESSQ
MGYRSGRKSSNGRSKLHAVREHRRSSRSRAGLSSCVHRCVGSEGLQKIRNHIMKALDFGIESGYLVPTDATYKMLRVSSELLEKRRRGRTEKKEGETTKYRRKGSEDSWNLRDKENKEVESADRSTKKFEEHSVQDARRRQSGRRNCRSRSRSRGNRRRSRRRCRRCSPENPEEMGEDEDDYESNKNSGKRNARKERASSGSRSSRSKTQEIDRTDVGRSDDVSDISLDEDETDDEGDKKEKNPTKS